MIYSFRAFQESGKFYAPPVIVIAAPAIAAAPGAIGSFGARGLGWYYAFQGYAANVLLGGGTAGYVIGRYPGYVEAAKAEGMSALNAAPQIFNTVSRLGLWQDLNMAYIDAQIWLNEQVYLSDAPIGQEGSGFAAELRHLISRGIGPDRWKFVPNQHIYNGPF